jgi:hypothetical protein
MDTIHPLLESTAINWSGKGVVRSVNRFIKGLAMFSKITSLPFVPVPQIDLEDSEYAQSVKILDNLWKNPRKQLNILDSKDNVNWSIYDEVAINRQVIDSKREILQDRFTDQLAVELGSNGNIAFQFFDAGSGLLENSDYVKITCTLIEEWVIDDSITPISQSVPFGLSLSANNSQVIIPANQNRKIIAITNTSNENDCFINLGNTALLNQGICLKSNGGSFTLDMISTPYYGNISAISIGEVLVTGLEGS